MKKTLSVLLSAMLCISFFRVLPEKKAYAAVDALKVQDMKTGGVTKELMVEKLLGKDVVASNIQYRGVPVAAGLFQGGKNIIGIEEGIILSTGKAADVIGPNDTPSKSAMSGMPGDPDLDKLGLGGHTYDAAVLEFDFVPKGDSVSFQYVLASEEYNEFLKYSDIVGLFVNGANTAWLPTNPPVAVNISNVNLGKNPQYYINNENGKLNTQMDGMTVVLSAQAAVKPNEINHLKLAVADYGDDKLDTNVFFKAGSLNSKPVTPGQFAFGEPQIKPENNGLRAKVEVKRANGSDGTASVQWTASGNASEDSTNTLTFGDGETSKIVELPIIPGETIYLQLENPTGGATIDEEHSYVEIHAPVTVVKVVADKENGSYKAGVEIPITVYFNGDIFLQSELPTLMKIPEKELGELILNSGATVKCTGKVGKNAISFLYTIKEGENAKYLDYLNMDSLVLQDNSLFDISYKNVIPKLPLPGSVNSISGTKKIIVDTTAPVIILTGGSETKTVLSKTFTDPGYKVTDNFDENLGSKVVVSGSVDTSKKGKYLLKYNVLDAAGNPALEVIRTVEVVDALELPKTGAQMDYNVLLSIGILIMAAGAVTLIYKKKNE